MGLWSRIAELVQSHRNKPRRGRGVERDALRRCRFELMEPRRMLNADPIRVGAVYIEEDLGSDLHGDTFEVTFEGGAAGTELTRLIIDGDQSTPGFGVGDVFFDTIEGGFGADDAFPFTLNSFTSQNPNASVTATVTDGGSQLVLDFVGFQAGDKLVFSVDVDEVEDFDPVETDLVLINEGFDPLTSGVEFQGTLFTTHFTAPHYHDATGNAQFRNRYDDNLDPLGLNLTADDADGKRDRTAGVGMQVSQSPVLAEISGYVYHDRSDDGSRDPGEEGIAGVSIEVIPVDTIEPQGTVTLTTDADGFYHATGLIPGSYRIVQANQPSGFYDGLDTAGLVDGLPVGNAVNPGDNLEGIFLGGGASGVGFNFGELAPASIRGSVHLTDPDGNCFTETSGERPVAGVTIRLLDAQNQLVAETLTNANGDYEFTNLRPGLYSVVEVTPADLIDGAEHVGTIGGVVVGHVGANDVLAGILLTSAAEAINYDFCEHESAALSGFVYHDANENGEFDSSEESIGGVVIALQDGGGSIIATQQTGPDGSYAFTGLGAGTYTVVETQPAGWIDGRDTAGRVRGATVGVAGNDRISQVALKWGDEGVNYNFGELRPASISGHVYHDRSDDGSRDPGEEGIAGVELQVVRVTGGPGQAPITVTTNADGFYEATGLVPGEYRVVESQPATYLDGIDAAGTVGGVARGTATNPGDEIHGIVLASSQAGIHYDFGELQPVSISGHVYHDRSDDGVRGPGEEGIAGVKLQVTRVNAGPGQTPITVTTNADGFYEATGLVPGEYRVVESQPATYLDGIDAAGTVGGVARGTATNPGDEIKGIVLASGQAGIHYDFGELQPVSVSGYVYHDRSDDGARDPGEEGIAGVKLQVIPVTGGPGQTPITVTTNADGFYEATGLVPGEYRVVESQPATYLDGIDAAGTVGGVVRGTATNPGDEIKGIVLASGQAGVQYNFGELQPVSISGYVYHDRSDDGERDPGEEGIAGVKLQVTRVNAGPGQTPITVTTNGDGFYEATGLVPGEYRIVESQPVSYLDGIDAAGTVGGVVRGTATNPGDEIKGIVLASGESGIHYDFGELQPVSLSGYVYHDRANDGTRDPGDEGIAGVELQVIRVTGGPGQAPMTVTTNAEGFYEATELFPGEYRVVESQPASYQDGTDRAGTVNGVVRGAATNPGDEISRIVLASGNAGVQYNFGEYQLASLSGHVHLSDPNGDCFGPGVDTRGLADVLVTLLDGNGAVVSTTRTDANGEYSFGDLLPGTYTIVEQTPAGLIDGGEHIGTVNGQSLGAISQNDTLSAIVLTSGQVGVNYDFCEHAPASLAGNVYHDRANNGSFEPGDEGIGGVQVTLRDATGAVVAIAVTSPDGAYEFTGLRAGTYTVTEQQPPGWIDGKDTAGFIDGQTVGAASNDQFSGVTLRWGDDATQYNFGEFLAASISGIVHADTNGDCIVDVGEARLAGVTVELLDEQGGVVAATVTDSNGEYEFNGLLPGSYSVRETQPVDYFDGGEVVGDGGGAVGASDLLTGIVITSGDEFRGYNFCELPPASLSGFVFQDGAPIRTSDGQAPANLQQLRDGQFTPDDTPIAGVTLELRDGRTGVVIDASQTLAGTYPAGPVRATTDANGFYEFTGLLGGREYAVYQLHPDGFHDSIDTPGSPQALAFNVGTVIPAGSLIQLAEPHRNDAIIRIPVEVGGAAQNNNFSEVVVEADPPPSPPLPPAPPLPTPELPQLAAPPLISTPPPAAGVIGPLLNVYAGGVEGAVGFTWHLSVINGGQPRQFADNQPSSEIWREARFLDYANWQPDHMRSAEWTLAVGQHDATDEFEVRRYIFGVRGGIPVSGDFNGDGIDEIGVFFQGEWFIDLNGNGYWDEEDLWARLGGKEDLPVTGDWDGDGKDDIGTFGPEWLGDPRALEAEPGLPDQDNSGRFVAARQRPKNVPPSQQNATDGRRLLQLNEHGPRRVDVVDHVFRFGAGRDIPVAGDWNGEGIRSIGVFRDGTWQLDLDGDGRWSSNDAIVQFGQTGDIPVVGDFDGNGIDEIGVYRGGEWLIDSDGDRELTAHDRVFELGGANDHPVVGDWNGDGIDEPGLYREINYQPETDVNN